MSIERHGLPNPLVCGRKFCAHCGRWRHACDFAPDPHNANSGLRSYCRTCDRARRRLAHARMTQEQRRLRAEYFRIRAEAKRRERGVTPREFKQRRSVVDRQEYRFLPVDPIAFEVRSYLAHPDVGMTVGDQGFGIEGLAARADVPARSIGRILAGETRRVRLDLADKLALAVGSHLYALYGDTPTVRPAPGHSEW